MSVLVSWSHTVDADPSGDVSTPAGNGKRLLILVRHDQFNEDVFGAVNPVITIGGQSPDLEFELAVTVPTDARLYVVMFKDATIENFATQAINYSDSQNVNIRGWAYCVLDDIDQPDPVKDSQPYEASSGDEHIISGLTSDAGDYQLCVLTHGITQNRSYATATPDWVELYDDDLATNAGIWAADNTTGGSSGITVDQNVADLLNTVIYAFTIRAASSVVSKTLTSSIDVSDVPDEESTRLKPGDRIESMEDAFLDRRLLDRLTAEYVEAIQDALLITKSNAPRERILLDSLTLTDAVQAAISRANRILLNAVEVNDSLTSSRSRFRRNTLLGNRAFVLDQMIKSYGFSEQLQDALIDMADGIERHLMRSRVTADYAQMWDNYIATYIEADEEPTQIFNKLLIEEVFANDAIVRAFAHSVIVQSSVSSRDSFLFRRSLHQLDNIMCSDQIIVNPLPAIVDGFDVFPIIVSIGGIEIVIDIRRRGGGGGTVPPIIEQPVVTAIPQEIWDPEIYNAGNLTTDQMVNNSAWVREIDPDTGALSNPTQIGVDIAPLGTTLNGPEFVWDSVGYRVIFTKENDQSVYQMWVYVPGVGIAPIHGQATTQRRQSGIGSSNALGTGYRIVYLQGSIAAGGPIVWCDIAIPGVETTVFSMPPGAAGDLPRWMEDTWLLFFIDVNDNEMYRLDTETDVKTQLTSDGGSVGERSFAYGFYAPEESKTLIVVIAEDADQLEIYHIDGDTAAKLYTIAPPIEAVARGLTVFGSPEPFVLAGQSYISYTIKNPAGTKQDIYLTKPDGLWSYRCHDSAVKDRSDPEVFIGSERLFVIWNVKNEAHTAELSKTTLEVV